MPSAENEVYLKGLGLGLGLGNRAEDKVMGEDRKIDRVGPNTWSERNR